MTKPKRPKPKPQRIDVERWAVRSHYEDGSVYVPNELHGTRRDAKKSAAEWYHGVAVPVRVTEIVPKPKRRTKRA